jgi:hypothetical protein
VEHRGEPLGGRHIDLFTACEGRKRKDVERQLSFGALANR